ncbi:TonB-dependent receptor [Stenotrophomonas ginsengisoli]|uniref:TonB-dependent receptor n=1 Tax=Stenotrophomonas ginsengisoli TaxID=336566 RepID=A0A0R0DIB5_9GAMM|nr:TonB-dependent receptor [Stenotrophomonas ginsengisoli]KRG77299.1 TonB-dependent receptor [Stenotrophomonas ginsengisoli]
MSTLRPTPLSSALLLALAAPALAHASTAPADETSSVDSATDLDKVQVTGSWFAPSSSKFTAALLDTPKSVTVVNKETLQEIGATTLVDALRMVPGITFGAGEGGNSTGDRPFLRGFDGQSNMFVDGLRDVGTQNREVFALEQLEVVKGPSSAYGGRDSGGGSINLVSKTPKLTDQTRISMGVGTDGYARGTIDANYVLGDGIAARLNLLKHDNDIAGRDFVNNSRWGIAPSIAFGLNGPLKLIASHYHLQTDDLPDAGGFPFGNPETKTTVGRPMVPDRNNFYGLLDRDFQRTRADITTVDASYELGNGHTLRNVARLGNTSNDYLWTQPDDSKNNPNLYGTLWRRTNSRAIDTQTLADQLSLTGAFQTGRLKHSYSAGVEYSEEESSKGSYVLGGGGTNNPLTGNTACATTGAATGYNCTDFANPNPRDPWAATHPVTRSDKALDVTQTTVTKSAYVFDTIELSERWLLNLGLRWDDYDTEIVTPVAGKAPTVLPYSDSFLNYQAGLVFKPTSNGSIYFSWGTSSTPPGMDSGEGNDSLTAAIADLKAQETSNIELGTKWDLLDNRLNLTAAIFHTEMDNARVTVDNGTTQNAGKKVIDGVELGVTGQLSRNWSVSAGYTWMDSELSENGYVCSVSSRNGCPAPGVWVVSPNNGNLFPNTPEHSATLWTSYRFGSGLTIGGGASYVGKQYGDAANTKWIPGYTRFDAMASYTISDNVSVQLNVQNLTDKLYFTKAYASHYAGIAPGRSATLALNVGF